MPQKIALLVSERQSIRKAIGNTGIAHCVGYETELEELRKDVGRGYVSHFLIIFSDPVITDVAVNIPGIRLPHDFM